MTLIRTTYISVEVAHTLRKALADVILYTSDDEEGKNAAIARSIIDAKLAMPVDDQIEIKPNSLLGRAAASLGYVND